MDCSHGWSGAAAQQPDAKPVENRHIISLWSPWRGEGFARWTDWYAIPGACLTMLLAVLRASWSFLRPSGAEKVERRMNPRVALSPLCSGPCSTRGYTPPPLRGVCLCPYACRQECTASKPVRPEP